MAHKKYKPNKVDLWFKWIGIPLVAFLMSYGMNTASYQSGFSEGMLAFLIGMMYTSILWEGNERIVYWHRTRFPGFQNTVRRVIRQSIFSVVYTLAAQVILALIEFYLLGYKYGKAVNLDLPLCFLIALIPASMAILLSESVYFFNAWKADLQKSEALARENLQTQFEALKKQLDPHFLFNSLNTLASLIDLDNDPAQEYLGRLSDVYRYVLETREKATVTLKEELDFLENYLYLNKVRFQDNLQFEQSLPEKTYSQHVPALSLQLLVENAIKHNVISRDRPLKIRIFSEADGIHVENNKQLKKSLGTSTRVGLQNIINRYKLLGNEAVEIMNEEERFVVKLPLLNPVSIA